VNANTLQQLFKRYRKPGDLVFAVVLLIFAMVLLSQLGVQTKWLPQKALIAQPRFWPAISVGGMVIFGALHLIGSLCSPRIRGRREEVLFWARSLEYAVWFLAYVVVEPVIGYLVSTVLFCLLLTLRAGYRDKRILLASIAAAFGIVLVFRGLLHVKMPAGLLYTYLPETLRVFMLSNM
jgi:hypothetical protein